MLLQRYPHNPIVVPGQPVWRQVATFNPGVVLDGGTFYMLERACSSLAPLYSQFGLLESTDGFHFKHTADEPVFTSSMLGMPQGTVEDPRLVKLEGWFYMTYVHRNYASSCYPNGKGIPDYYSSPDVPPGDPNNYRSGIARSRDLRSWENLGLCTPPDVDDRDCVLFPEKIGGRYAMLRRPANYVGPRYGCDRPSIWLSYSDDLLEWTTPELVAKAADVPWELRKIGAAAIPMKTDAGWLVLYHGVDADVVYRTGVMLLDLENPARVIARSPEFILEPQEYYENVGLIIPRVVFPSANVVKEGVIYVYYGCADTCISVATVELQSLLEYVNRYRA
jgi:beta-1,2-mannobiose phosphorylase / 1,2-beta-oligomannan phosphorylase